MSDLITAHGITYVRKRLGVYKYELQRRYEHPEPVAIRPATPVDHPFMTLSTTGALTVEDKYAWDGASGPVPDTPDVMRASLVHDALYQMIRQKLVPWNWGRNRKHADAAFRDTCIADGMSPAKATLLYHGLRLIGAPATWRFLR
ncbi:MAG: DUF1353 domain-containing protein [Polyangiaceae bacterium]